MNEEEQDELEIRQKFLIFTIDRDLYAISITDVRELIRFPKMVPIPDVPKYIVGVTNLRSRVTPLIDMRMRLHMETCVRYSDRTVVIILEREDLFCGLIVDEVLDVLLIPEQSMEKAPKVGNMEHPLIEKITHRNNGICMILDIARLFEDSEDARSIDMQQEL